tara:strand:- start:2011 stop:3165 length:1155 start_codon:yes stop_codon:yes gene_type:complete
MKTYILFPNNLELKAHSLLSSEDNFLKTSNDIFLNELSFIESKDNLFYLMPSTLVSSHTFVKNDKLSHSNNLANFISEVDTDLANDVSENSFFIFDKNGFVINKNILDEINSSLSKLKCKSIVIPDYFINQTSDFDTITHFNDKFIFAYKDGTGSSIELNQIEYYLTIIRNIIPDFNPTIYSPSEDIKKLFQDSDFYPEVNYKNFLKKNFDKLPNFFKFKPSLKNISTKLDITKNEIFAFVASCIIIFSTPLVLINNNNKTAKDYENATFSIFKKIDNNIKRVVAPRNQIDEILKQLPNVNKEVSSRTLPIKNLDFLVSMGDKYLESVNLDINQNQANILFSNMPEAQFKIIKGLSENFDIAILNEDVVMLDNKVSGEIKLGFK